MLLKLLPKAARQLWLPIFFIKLWNYALQILGPQCVLSWYRPCLGDENVSFPTKGTHACLPVQETRRCPTSFLMSSLSTRRKFILSHQRNSCLPCQRDETLSYTSNKIYLVPPKVLMCFLSKGRDSVLPVSWCRPYPHRTTLSRPTTGTHVFPV